MTRHTIDGWVTAAETAHWARLRRAGAGEDVSDAMTWPRGRAFLAPFAPLVHATVGGLAAWWAPCTACGDTGLMLTPCPQCRGSGQRRCICPTCDHAHDADCNCGGARMRERTCVACQLTVRVGRIAGVVVDRRLLRQLVEGLGPETACAVGALGGALVVEVGEERLVLMQCAGETTVEWEQP